MKKVSVENYYKGCLEYEYCPDKKTFIHNIENDFHLFMIWEGGLEKTQQIIEEIQTKFDVFFQARVNWNQDKITENISRFYKIDDKDLIKNHCKNKARQGSFYCLVVEDKNPKYNYRQNVSGPIRLVNTNNLEVKRKIRSSMNGNFLHSSSCPEEFFEQIYLLFNSELINNIFSKELTEQVIDYNKDLVGSNGWSSLEEYFNVLNKCSDYLIQRSYHNTKNVLESQVYGKGYKINDKDIDLICSSIDDMLYASNSYLKKFDGIDVYYTNISKTEIRIDIENCLYDPTWIKNSLKRKEMYEGMFYVAQPYDYFFLLIYHESIIKSTIKEHHKAMLTSIANNYDFDFFSQNTLNNDELKAKLLCGYLTANGYKIYKPTIKERKGHYTLNNNVIKYMDSNLFTFRANSLQELYRKIVPKGARKLIPTSLKKFIRKII